MTSRIEDYIYFNKKIGKGSFSRVYKGYKVGLPDKLYAIKKMEYDPDNQRLKKRNRSYEKYFTSEYCKII